MEIPQWGRESRRIRRETARQIAKQYMQQHGQPERGKRKVDVGWLMAAFMALGLLLVAPKVGRAVTCVVMVLMATCLIHPIWYLQFIQATSTKIGRGIRFALVMLLSLLLLSGFGLYVWPPIRRHTLKADERVRFENMLKEVKGDDANLEVHVACPIGDEKTCVYAGQFVSLFGAAGWQVEPSVERLTLARGADGISAIRKAGNKDYMLKHWNSGGYVAINEAHLLAVQNAFRTISIEIDSGADPDLGQNVMRLYVGPEKDNESEPTNLTRSTDWALGKTHGPFPAQQP